MDRRTFLSTAVAAPAAVAAAGPLILGADDKAGTKRPRVGAGEHTYECHHGWGELPPGFEWQTTHNVAVDADGLVYVAHQGLDKQPVVDTVLVFDPAGKFVRSFGKGWHGGGHGLDIRTEGGEQFVYLCNTSKSPKVVKATLTGEIVWSKGRPAAKEYEPPKAAYSPTNVAFLPDGGFVVADGYGSNYLIAYDAGGELRRVFGGPGDQLGRCKTPHGLWVDGRGDRPVLVVCDRANARLQAFDLDGNPLSATDPRATVLFPANIDVRGDVMLVPDLHARVSLLDKDLKPVAHLGDDAEWRKAVLDGFKVRTQPGRWEGGKFVHPHDACFDKDGNIFVAEWVHTGRITLLKKVG